MNNLLRFNTSENAVRPLFRYKPGFFLPVLLFGLLGLTQSAKAQSTGEFISLGTSIPNGACLATALRDGRVLFAGSRSAGIYDPSTGTFLPTGGIDARCGGSATLLQDGRVLVAGGWAVSSVNGVLSFSSFAGAEIYDPSTGASQRTGDMITGRFDHTAILLGNGKVLIAGGTLLVDATHGVTAPAELYDPATGTFARAGDAGNSRYLTASLLTDGRVLLVGGNPPYSIFTITATIAELYDPAAGTFSTLNSANLPQPLLGHSATLLANGKVLIVGGNTEYPDPSDAEPDDTLQNAELYDPSTETFTDTGRLIRARAFHTATMLPGGKVFISGGLCDGDCSLTELYDPALGTFAAAGNRLDSSYISRSANLLADGTVLLTEGTSSELYVPAPLAVSSASLTSPLAPESLASLFGARLTAATASADLAAPPTSLGGISLNMRDGTGVERLARLLYVSPSQINFEVPPGTALGDTALEVINGAETSLSVTAQVSGIAAGLFAFPGNQAVAYAVRIEADGSQTTIHARSSIVLDDRQVYLILFGTGIRNRSSLANVRCTIGGITVPVEYAGPDGGGVPGLDQVNVRLTTDLKGNSDGHLVLTVDGSPSNTVLVDIR